MREASARNAVVLGLNNARNLVEQSCINLAVRSPRCPLKRWNVSPIQHRLSIHLATRPAPTMNINRNWIESKAKSRIYETIPFAGLYLTGREVSSFEVLAPRRLNLYQTYTTVYQCLLRNLLKRSGPLLPKRESKDISTGGKVQFNNDISKLKRRVCCRARKRNERRRELK